MWETSKLFNESGNFFNQREKAHWGDWVRDIKKNLCWFLWSETTPEELHENKKLYFIHVGKPSTGAEKSVAEKKSSLDVGLDFIYMFFCCVT